MKSKNKRLMVIRYHNDDDMARLKTVLDMCCVPFVAFCEYDFADGNHEWKIYIDKAQRTWEQVMREVNSVRPVPFRYESGHYIENGMLYCDF